ncbi:hypothetical protein NL676_029820 [Syzygium grande]|nr:hypothetical protein NL676_029820 [Syzygium grande]
MIIFFHQGSLQFSSERSIKTRAEMVELCEKRARGDPMLSGCNDREHSAGELTRVIARVTEAETDSHKWRERATRPEKED